MDEAGSITASISHTDVTCAGAMDGTASVTASSTNGNVTYQWDDPMNSTGSSITGLAGNTYSVTISDGTACQLVRSVEVLEPSSINLALSSTDVECNGSLGTVTVEATGGTSGNTGYTYLWDDAGMSTTPSVQGLEAGTYRVVVTDEEGCTSEGEVEVSAAPMLELSGEQRNVSCAGETDGMVRVIVDVGNSPYTYDWGGASTTDSLAGIGVGTYDVTVTDADQCASVFSFTLTEPDPLNANGVNGFVSGVGATDGSVTVNVSGGTYPYSYVWTPGARRIALSMT